jgi:hypothetical protein
MTKVGMAFRINEEPTMINERLYRIGILFFIFFVACPMWGLAKSPLATLRRGKCSMKSIVPIVMEPMESETGQIPNS